MQTDRSKLVLKKTQFKPACAFDSNSILGTIIFEIDKARERGENHIKFQNIYSGATSPLKASVSIFYQAYEEVLKKRNLIVR